MPLRYFRARENGLVSEAASQVSVSRYEVQLRLHLESAPLSRTLNTMPRCPSLLTLGQALAPWRR